jgi:pimeloyl-ACP methyl ester carboxylesterase
MTTDRYEGLDELALLEEEAAEFGLPWTGPPKVHREEVPTEGGTVSLLRWGDEPAELALLHGAALNAHTWDAFALALRRPLIALDLPGHGHSAWRTDARYDAATLASATADVIASRAPSADVVVGHSLGGLAAVALASARPDLVRSLVLIDVSPGITSAEQVRSFLAGPEVFSSREEIVTRARSFGFGHSDEAVARAVWLNTNVREDGSVVWKHHFGHLGGLAASDGETNRTVDATALWPALESYRGSVLLIRGERGFISEEDGRDLIRRVPGAEVVTVPTGHNVQEDDPVLLAEIIGRFLEQTTRAKLPTR